MTGVRTSKTVNGKKPEYRLCGTQVVEMIRPEAVSSTSEHPISYTFTYDESGRPYSVHRESMYNSNALSEFYYYMTNLQGDVIKILDYDKNVVANYSYDAWGRVIAVTDANGNAITGENHIGNTNPLIC